MRKGRLFFLVFAFAAVTVSAAVLHWYFSVTGCEMLREVLLSILSGCVFAAPGYAAVIFDDRRKLKRKNIEFVGGVQRILREILSAEFDSFSLGIARNTRNQLAALTTTFSMDSSAYILESYNWHDALLCECFSVCTALGGFSQGTTQEDRRARFAELQDAALRCSRILKEKND